MSALEAWQGLFEAAGRLRRRLPGAASGRIRNKETKSAATQMSLQYFQQVRPLIATAAKDEITQIDELFNRLLRLASGSGQVASYRMRLNELQKLQPAVSAKLAQSGSQNDTKTTIGPDDERIARTLEGLVPSAARSFKQALIDLTDPKRHSYRGPAVELREALRETLDALAPDEEVTQMEGYKQEKDRNGPTMKQKVRFILRARGMKDETAPEQAASAVEEIVGTFARSVYTMSNAGTHGTKERSDVMRIRRYVTIVMHDILALPE